MGVGIDIGTGNVLGAKEENGKEIFLIDRDAFYAKDKANFNEEMAKSSGMAYIDTGDGYIYIIGEDAFKFAHTTGDSKNYHRPMAKGVLNPGEDKAVAMVSLLVERVIGKASTSGEPCAVTCPASPVDADFDVTFHKAMVSRFVEGLGYKAYPINEALGIIYAENPKTTENGEELPFTGMALSFGAGMVNMCLAWRSEPLVELSIARGGDWIDEQVAKNTGKPVSAITNVKEKEFSLCNVDFSNKVQLGLDIYYRELLRYAFEKFDEALEASSAQIDTPMTAVLAGGTSLVAGFTNLVELQLLGTKIGQNVAEIVMAKDPLKAPVQGALAYAISKED